MRRKVSRTVAVAVRCGDDASPGGCLKPCERAPVRGEATISSSGRQPVSWLAQRIYNPSKGLVKTSGVGTPAFRTF